MLSLEEIDILKTVLKEKHISYQYHAFPSIIKKLIFSGYLQINEKKLISLRKKGIDILSNYKNGNN